MKSRAAWPIFQAVFLLSGFAALLYQMIWQRLLTLFGGAEAFAKKTFAEPATLYDNYKTRTDAIKENKQRVFDDLTRRAAGAVSRSASQPPPGRTGGRRVPGYRRRLADRQRDEPALLGR